MPLATAGRAEGQQGLRSPSEHVLKAGRTTVYVSPARPDSLPSRHHSMDGPRTRGPLCRPRPPVSSLQQPPKTNWFRPLPLA